MTKGLLLFWGHQQDSSLATLVKLHGVIFCEDSLLWSALCSFFHPCNLYWSEIQALLWAIRMGKQQLNWDCKDTRPKEAKSGHYLLLRQMSKRLIQLCATGLLCGALSRVFGCWDVEMPWRRKRPYQVRRVKYLMFTEHKQRHLFWLYQGR